jgi:hypothetical protein
VDMRLRPEWGCADPRGNIFSGGLITARCGRASQLHRYRTLYAGVRDAPRENFRRRKISRSCRNLKENAVRRRRRFTQPFLPIRLNAHVIKPSIPKKASKDPHYFFPLITLMIVNTTVATAATSISNRPPPCATMLQIGTMLNHTTRSTAPPQVSFVSRGRGSTWAPETIMSSTRWDASRCCLSLYAARARWNCASDAFSTGSHSSSCAALARCCSGVKTDFTSVFFVLIGSKYSCVGRQNICGTSTS